MSLEGGGGACAPSELCAVGGGGGGGGGGGDRDPCQECLDSCRDLGIPSCCTGAGCLCQDECRPSRCPPGTEFCCGPYGDCLCLENCPY